MQVRRSGAPDAAALAVLGVCGGADTFVLEKDGSVIGAARMQESCLVQCVLAPEWRRRGYGTFLLRRMLRCYPGAARALCPENAPAQALLRRCGFRPKEQGEPWVRGVPHDDGENALSVAHAFLKEHVRAGMTAIDATAGNGGDTLFLCRLVGHGGRVLAFDIQPQAVDNTNKKLAETGYGETGKAVLDSHANLAAYAQPGSVDAVMFNLGYLPGGDHSVFTEKETSIPAIGTALSLLKKGGVMTVCVYSGGAQGTAERDAVLQFFAQLPKAQYDVAVRDFKEQAGLPPVPVCVVKK